MNDKISELNRLAAEKMEIISRIRAEYEKVMVGQEKLFLRMVSALLSGGHILLEGVPGLAKTLAISTLSHTLGLDFQRIQFTPDMLPADIRGTMIYNQHKAEFEVKKGPVFTNFILADEINRAPAKVQSALLDVMQERSVTLGDQTWDLPRPFLVMATQNPIEQEGTYPLPEAQVDRFYMKVRVDYPDKDEEKSIIRRMGGTSIPQTTPVVKPQEILKLQDFMEEIYVDDKIVDYIVDLVHATRHSQDYQLPADYIRYGASPRASLSFIRAARVEAFLDGRGYVIPEDVKEIAPDVLRHRLGLSFEAEAENMTPDSIIVHLLNHVEIP